MLEICINELSSAVINRDVGLEIVQGLPSPAWDLEKFGGSPLLCGNMLEICMNELSSKSPIEV